MSKIIGYVSFHLIPESIKSFLKIKEDTWLCSFTKTDLKQFKIKPENLKFNIIKDSDKIMLVAQNGAEQTNESNKPTRSKEVYTIGK